MEKNIQTELDRIIHSINTLKDPNDLCFCILSGTELTDAGSDARQHISAIDHALHLDCLIHLGDVLRGNNPKNISCRLLQTELSSYQKTIQNGHFFITQGDQDGYRDEAFCGQLVLGIMNDKLWYENTACIHAHSNVHRPHNVPYYYVDYPAKHVRLIFLCSSFCEFDEDNLLFERHTSFDLSQLAWLQNEALQVDKSWQVVLFSHSMPKSRFDTGADPFFYHEFSTEKFLSIVMQAQRTRQFDLVGWYAGHYRYDAEVKIGPLNHILIETAAPHPSVELKFPEVRSYPARSAGTASGSLFDVVVLKSDERKLYSFRFGPGNDRVITF